MSILITQKSGGGIGSLNGLTASSQTFVNDTNVTVTSVGSTHTLGWSGNLAVARGGTGLNALGSPLQVLRVNAGGTALEYATVSTGLTNWTESFTSVTQASSVFTATNAATNVNAVITPKGNAAFILGPAPDGTVTGGNSRGTYAVDLQYNRSFATEVCQGVLSSITGGQRNTLIGSFSHIGGGFANSIGTNSSYSVIACARECTIGGSNFGYGAILGGYLHQVFASYGMVGGGQSNQILAGGTYGAILGGNGNRVIGPGAWTGGGTQAYAYNQNAFAMASGMRVTQGDKQKQAGIYSNTLTNVSSGSATRLWLDGPTATVNFNANGNDRSWNFRVRLIATCSATSGSLTIGDSFSQTVEGLFKRVAGTGTIVGQTIISTHNDASMAGGAILLGIVSNQLTVSFTHPTGASNNDFYVVAEISVVEVA